jgi:hypothetical protein
MPLTTKEQASAVAKVAEAFGWDSMSTDDVRLMLWALFRYYTARLGRKGEDTWP